MALRFRALTGPITHYRARLDLTITQLADAVGLNRSTLTNQINGRQAMPWPVAARLAQLLDVPPDLIVEAIHEPDGDAEREREAV